MKEFMSHLFNKYAYRLFTIETTTAMKMEIAEEVYRRCPDIKSYVKVEGKEIHFDENFFRKNNGMIPFIPCLFSIKEDFYYDVYLGFMPVGQICFSKNLDPRNYGYTVYTQSLNSGRKIYSVLCYK